MRPGPQARRLALHLAAAGALTCVCAGGATGATIRAIPSDASPEDGKAIFRAAKGERNDVLIGNHPSQPCHSGEIHWLCVSDTGALLEARRGCELLDQSVARCFETEEYSWSVVRGVLVLLRDGDDAVWEESYSRTVRLVGGAGDDSLHSGSGVGKSPTLDGGRGNDELRVYNNGRGGPLVHGGPDDDYLCAWCEGAWSPYGSGQAYGGPGDDYIDSLVIANDSKQVDGGPGNDTYGWWGYSGPGVIDSTIVPGPGFDTLDGSRARGSLTADMRGCGQCVERILGGPDEDQFTSGVGSQILKGGDRADFLIDTRGSDVLGGQDGDDAIRSRDGAADRVVCGSGVDIVIADHTDDVCADCEVVRLP